MSCSQPSLALRIVLWAPSSGSFPSTVCFFMCNWDLRGNPRSLFFSLSAVLFSPIIYLTNSRYLGLSVSELCVLVAVRPPRLSPDNIGAVERLTSCVSLLSGINALCYLLSSVRKPLFHILYPIFQMFKARSKCRPYSSVPDTSGSPYTELYGIPVSCFTLAHLLPHLSPNSRVTGVFILTSFLSMHTCMSTYRLRQPLGLFSEDRNIYTTCFTIHCFLIVCHICVW